MAREGIIGIGSHNNDMRLHENLGAVKAPTGFTFPTQTDDAETAADAFGGTRWIRVDNSGGANLNIGTLEAVTPKDYQWICLNVFRLSGTLGVSDRTKILSVWDGSAFLDFEWAYDTDASHFKLSFVGVGRTTTNNFSVDTNLAIRIQLDGVRVKMWVNGVLEVDEVLTSQIESTRAIIWRPDGATQEHYYGFGCITQSDSISDRPNTTVEMQELQGASDWATEQEYGDDVDCSAASTTATYTDVNLDGSDEITTPAAWCEVAAEAGKQMSEMADLASGFTGTILGIFYHAAGNNSGGGAKTVNTNARIHDGTAADEKANANLVSTTITNRQHFWADPPGAANWEAVIKTASSTLRAGVSSNAANDDIEGWPGMVVEVYAVGDDPPVTENRRRVAAQVA